MAFLLVILGFTFSIQLSDGDKQLLGHKTINATLIYTQLIKFENDEEFHVRVAKTVKEACELAKVGFDKFTEMNGVQIFRKRK